MPTLEVFFDYACPYCLKNHHNLVELCGRYRSLDILWQPCEAHPRPDRYGPHSDLCLRGMLYARERGADLWDYHERMYKAALTGRVDIEKVDVVAGQVAGLLDPEQFAAMLRSGRFKKQLADANRYAWSENGLAAVPSYRCGSYRLNSVENVGVSRAQLKSYLNRHFEQK